MTCGHCEKAVASLAMEVNGVLSVKADKGRNSIEVDFEESLTDLNQIIDNINSHGGIQSKTYKMRTILSVAAAMSLTMASCSNQPEPEATTNNKELVMEQPTTMTVSIDGMTCAMGCAATIQKECSKLAGVAESKVDFASKEGSFTFDAAKLSQADLIKCIEGVNGGGAYKATVVSTGDAVPVGTEAVNEDGAMANGEHS